MQLGWKTFASLTWIVLLSNVTFGQTFSDDFNRADAADLGANYTNVVGSATRVISNRAGNVTGSNNLSMLNASNYSDSYTNTTVSVDIFHNGTAGTGYVALAFGHNGIASVANGLFIKVQDNGGGQFSNVGFYTGVNSTTNQFTVANFFALTSNFSTARMTVWASDANTINLGLDTNFDTTFDQLYTRTFTNVGTMTFGTQAGIGVFGTNVTADNLLVTSAAIPEPMTMSLVGVAVGLGGLVWWRKRRRISRL